MAKKGLEAEAGQGNIEVIIEPIRLKTNFQAAGRKPATPEDPIHSLYLWVDMGILRETRSFWKAARYAGRTVQSVKVRRL